MFSHINSAPRKSLYNNTPIEMAESNIGLDFANKLGIKKISKDEVTLNPSLLAKNK